MQFGLENTASLSFSYLALIHIKSGNYINITRFITTEFIMHSPMMFSGEFLYISIPCNNELAQFPTPAIAIFTLDNKNSSLINKYFYFKNWL